MDDADEAAVAGHEHRRMRTLPAELVDHVSALAPVGVDQTAFDGHLGAVVAAKAPGQEVTGELFQAGVDLPLEAGALGGGGQGDAQIAQGVVGPALVGPGAVVEDVSRRSA